MNKDSHTETPSPSFRGVYTKEDDFMGSRDIQKVQIRQKIERLQAQLDYLERLDSLEAKQSNSLESSEVQEKDASEKI